MGEGNWRIARGDRPIRLIDRPLGIGRLDNPPTPVFGAEPGPATTAALVQLDGRDAARRRPWHRARHARAAESGDAPFPLPARRRHGAVHGPLAAARRPASLRHQPRRPSAPVAHASPSSSSSSTRRSEMPAARSRRYASEALAANLALPAHGLVTLTWGNASAIDRDAGLVAIKPSGVSYAELTAERARRARTRREGRRRDRAGRRPIRPPIWRCTAPSPRSARSSTPTLHGRPYGRRRNVRSRCSGRRTPTCRHTRSRSRGRSTEDEIDADYEGATGAALIEAVREHGPSEVPCALVRGHGPFCWGRDRRRRRSRTPSRSRRWRGWPCSRRCWTPTRRRWPEPVRAKHYARKHGPDAYYGQS